MNEPSGLHPLEIGLGLLLSGLLLLGVGAWLVASLAGLLFAGGWPDLWLADAVTGVAGFPHHLGDPRDAWPARVRERLPGAFGMYASGSAVVAAVAAVSVVLARWWMTRTHEPAVARWARTRQLRPLLARVPQPNRVTLGRRGSRLVCCEPLHSALVIGPTQTGKTTGLAIPAILEWQGPVLATSVKTDLLRDTISVRRAGAACSCSTRRPQPE